MKMGLLLSSINMIHQMLVYQFDTLSDDAREWRRVPAIFTGGITQLAICPDWRN